MLSAGDAKDFGGGCCGSSIASFFNVDEVLLIKKGDATVGRDTFSCKLGHGPCQSGTRDITGDTVDVSWGMLSMLLARDTMDTMDTINT